MEYWKFKAIDKLRDYPLKAAAIQSLQEELQRLELEATNIRSATADATPVQGGGSARGGQAAVKYHPPRRDQADDCPGRSLRVMS